jgi:hypothetical protein
MKINQSTATNRLLRVDFAPRVVERVSRIKRRRRMQRRALAVTAVMALGFGAFLAERHGSIAPYQATVALQSPRAANLADDSSAKEQPVADQEPAQPPINMFLPDTYMMTNFEENTGESSWHSYDSWWDSNP